MNGSFNESACGVHQQHCKAILDLDNLLHRGFDKVARRPRPQAELDVLGLAHQLRAQGVEAGTICRNRPFPPLAQQLWERLGFECLSTGENCDAAAIKVCERYAAEGATRLVLATGDEDYLKLVKSLKARGIAVELVARTANCSKRLREVVDAFTAVDRYVRQPASHH